MSLDDESPTQYYGPNAVEFTGPHGKPIRVSQDHFNRLTESGALTDEQMLNAKQDGLSLADLLHEANTGHVKGCSFGRSARCNCMYLKQWDRAPAYTAPTYKMGVLSHKPLTAPEDIMAELDQLRTEMTMEDAAEISRRGTRERCTAHPYSWHFTDAMTCEQLNEQLLGVDGFSELTLHPSSMVRLAAETSNRLVKAAQQDTSDEKLRTKYWHKEYLSLGRRFRWMFALALAGWALSIARGVWGF